MGLETVMTESARSRERLRVGITGHRSLPQDSRLVDQVDHAISRIRDLADSASGAPPRMTAVSSLAEGADRLVAREVLKQSGSILEVPLPLPPVEYEKDFATKKSRLEFEALLRRADLILTMPPSLSRVAAYEAAGRYIVEHCHVLLALWDGMPARGQGGTAEIVALALESRLPLLWIATEPPFSISEDVNGTLRF
jgi:hypothetical protein